VSWNQDLGLTTANSPVKKIYDILKNVCLANMSCGKATKSGTRKEAQASVLRSQSRPSMRISTGGVCLRIGTLRSSTHSLQAIVGGNGVS